EVRPHLHRGQDPRPLTVRDDRRARRGLAGPPGRLGGARGAPRAETRDLRRARGRPRLGGVLPPRRPRLRLLLPVSGPDRPDRGGTGRDRARLTRRSGSAPSVRDPAIPGTRSETLPFREPSSGSRRRAENLVPRSHRVVRVVRVRAVWVVGAVLAVRVVRVVRVRVGAISAITGSPGRQRRKMTLKGAFS